MLQLAENKPRRHTQIAKKSKNGFPPFCSFSAAPSTARTAAPKTSAAPRIGVLRLAMLPCCRRFQPAISGIFVSARGEEVNDDDLG